MIKNIWRGSCYVGTPWDFQNIETKILRWGKPHILHFMGTMCVIGKVLDLIEASCAPRDFKNEPCRCIFFVTQNFATILNQIYNLNYGTTKWYRQINMNIIAIKGYRLQKSIFLTAFYQFLTNIARIANAVWVTLWLLVTNPQWQVFTKLKTKYTSSQLFEKHYSCRRPFCSLHPDLYVLWPDRIFCYNLDRILFIYSVVKLPALIIGRAGL